MFHPYKFSLKVQKKNREETDEVKRRKDSIQNGLKERLNILVNAPKQNYGSTNDGNTSRKFFNEAKIVSEVTGIYVNLLIKSKFVITFFL